MWKFKCGRFITIRQLIKAGWASKRLQQINNQVPLLLNEISLGIPQRCGWLKPLKDLMSSLLIFHRLLTKWWREWWPLKQQRDGHKKDRQGYLSTHPCPLPEKTRSISTLLYISIWLSQTTVPNVFNKLCLISQKIRKHKLKLFHPLIYSMDYPTAKPSLLVPHETSVKALRVKCLAVQQ